MSTVSAPYDFGPPEVRNGYLPPIYPVLRSVEPIAWHTIPPVALLTDLQGEEVVASPPRIAVCYTADALCLRAECPQPAATLLPDIAPDAPTFWRQDHIEFRLLRPDRAQLQFIFTPHGRFFDSMGLFGQDSVQTTGQSRADGWELTARIPFDVLGLPVPQPGHSLAGQVAYMRWEGSRHRITAFAATELGFNQEERFGTLVFGGPPASTPKVTTVTPLNDRLHRGSNPVAAVIEGLAPTAEVTVEIDCDDKQASLPVKLTPHGAATHARFDVPLSRPRFTRCRLVSDNTTLTAFSLRAAVPDLPADRPPPHPRLAPDAATRERLRQETSPLSAAAFARICAQTFPTGDDPQSFHFKPGQDAGGWYRVCKESFPRSGSRGARPAHAYIWERLDDAARAAAGRTVEKVRWEPTERDPIFAALNRLIDDPDFYSEAAFADLSLGTVGERLLAERAARPLSPVEVAKLNRQLLQAAIECIHCYGAHYLSSRDGLGDLLCGWQVDPRDELLAEMTRRVKAHRDLYLPDRHTHLHEGGSAKLLAQAYDAVCEALAPSDRQIWRDVIGLYFDQYLVSCLERAWTVMCVPNANAVSNSNLGLLALAVLEEDERAADVLQWARKNLTIFLDYCHGRDGGNTEGAQYWQYGLENLVPFALALEAIVGTDDGIFTHPALAKAMNMIRVGLSNDGCMHGVNDTIPLPVGQGLAWFCASRYQDDLGLWYGDHAAATYARLQAQDRDVPYRAIDRRYRPDRPPVERQPPLPTCIHLADIEYATVRSGANYDCALVAGLKGSRPPFTHHNQADSGSFWVHLKGERLLIDPGYYKGTATDHCLPLIDGRGPVQPSRYVAQVTACRQSEAHRYLAVDATPAYGGAAQRVCRHLLMLGEHTVVILDDLCPTHEDAPITCQYQAGGPTESDSPTHFTITGQAAGLNVRLDGPPGQIELAPERSLKDVHWGYKFASCRHFPVHFHYRLVPRCPLVTIIQDRDSDKVVTVERPSPPRLTIAVDGTPAATFDLDDRWTLTELAVAE